MIWRWIIWRKNKKIGSASPRQIFSTKTFGGKAGKSLTFPNVIWSIKLANPAKQHGPSQALVSVTRYRFLEKSSNKRMLTYTYLLLREDIRRKKTFSFGHCPNHLNPPSWPQFGQLGPLFLRQKQRFARMTGKKIDADNEGCNDNYDNNYDKND